MFLLYKEVQLISIFYKRFLLCHSVFLLKQNHAFRDRYEHSIIYEESYLAAKGGSAPTANACLKAPIALFWLVLLLS